ncbi:CRISPR system precrRNA processing endoribonuclease RAMP protein Cas6 [Afifella aestuarii]|uniref:CRISPR system precrRNA processing endoribonuclease RAMP protein Cas6 n=1 Tax=Afifella aestuarii TaxID=1909496 RepID=UPI000FE40657|nr:CRISPR system precrRNA processing endoribonuclease RAMP protein Cas6 [Afifella aestuarii]
MQERPADTPLTSLRAYLEAARQRPLVPVDLLATWRMARIELFCPGAAALAKNPNAPARMRGAWGRALAEGASAEALAGGPCPWPAPCAYDLFFNVQGRMTARLEIPKPFAIALDTDGNDLIVSLTLFGIAVDWAGEAADAMVRALRNGLDTHDRRRPLKVTDRRVGLASGLPAAEAGAGLLLSFVTPVALRSGAQMHVRPESLLTGVANRVGGLALWQGHALAIDPAALKAEADALGRRAEWQVETAPGWRNGSKAQRRERAMGGVLGTLMLPQPTPDLAALLRIGAETHVGSHAALGMGRYDLLTLAS